MINAMFFQGTIENIETRYSKAGNTIVIMTITNTFKTQKNEYQAMVKCTAFGDLGDWISSNFVEGDNIVVNGRFSSNTYKDKTYMDIIVQNAVRSGGGKRKKAAPKPKPKPKEEDYYEDEEEYEEEDPPF